MHKITLGRAYPIEQLYCYFKHKTKIFFFIDLLIFGCAESLLLCAGFLQLQQAGAALSGVWASYSGFPWGAQALGVRASVVAALGLRRCSLLAVLLAQGFSCSKACGIFWHQESNLCPLH